MQSYIQIHLPEEFLFYMLLEILVFQLLASVTPPICVNKIYYNKLTGAIVGITAFPGSS